VLTVLVVYQIGFISQAITKLQKKIFKSSIIKNGLGVRKMTFKNINVLFRKFHAILAKKITVRSVFIFLQKLLICFVNDQKLKFCHSLIFENLRFVKKTLPSPSENKQNLNILADSNLP